MSAFGPGTDARCGEAGGDGLRHGPPPAAVSYSCGGSYRVLRRGRRSFPGRHSSSGPGESAGSERTRPTRSVRHPRLSVGTRRCGPTMFAERAHDPLAFLSAEVEAAQGAGAVPAPARARRGTARRDHVRPPPGRQPLVEQLPGSDDASAAARARARGHQTLRRRHRVGPHDRRHHEPPRGARGTARGVQADRGGGRVSERLHGQRRDGVVHPLARTTSSSRTS